ncbi:MAG: Peripla 6 protein [Thermoproteota archaeon]|nr:Peripla 6 protein [Thermoproteota archaeon]
MSHIKLNIGNSRRGISTTIAVVAMVVMLIIGIAGGYFLAPTKTTPVTEPKLKGVLNIGAALPLTGELATYGQNAQTALIYAKNQINKLLNATNAGYTLNVVVQDTQTKPDIALTVTQNLYTQGCKAILGYYSSGELSNCMSYAQTNQIVLVSPSSTAISLAIEKPYIYRYCPADDKQGPAIARGMKDLNLSYIIPIWRGDTYGDGLVQSTTTRFAQLGGSFDANGIRYDINTAEFSSQASVLAAKVQTAVSQIGANKVGILAVTFEEITAIMTAATSYPILMQVKWFGCDGSALSAKITQDSTVANFCVQTMFPATYFAPPSSSILTNVSNYVKQQVGHTPDPYAFGSYDSLWAVAKCIGMTQQYTGAAINKVFGAVSNMTFGASGWTALNRFGDRTIGDYQFWQVYTKNATTFDWYNSGLYSAATDAIAWYPVP